MTSTVDRMDCPADVRSTYDRPTTARLGRRASLLLFASIIVSFLAGSSAPTPLYATYSARWGFGPVTVTVVFGVYALAVLSALLVFGRLSDHVGRRPVLFAALAAQSVAMVVFATASVVPELLAARVIQGLAAGAALGTLGAAMIDVDRERGTLLNTMAPGFGTGVGALLAALVVQYLPAPTRLVYLLLIAVFAVQALGLVFVRESVTRAPGARASLRPELAVPRAARAAVLTAAPVLFAGWSLPGLYGSLGPALIARVTGSDFTVLGSLGLFALAGVTPFAALALHRTDARRSMWLGVVGLIVGVGLVLLAEAVDSVPLFFTATVLAGIGFGAAFQGGIRLVVPFAAAHQRAGVLSVLFVVSYLGLGVPAVVAGLLVAHVSPLLTVAREYGAFVILMALLAALGLVLTRPRPAA